MDAYPDRRMNLLDLWILEESGSRTRLSVPYYPRILVSGPEGDLMVIKALLEERDEVRSAEVVERPLEVGDDRKRKCLSVAISDYSAIRRTAEWVERMGRWKRYRLYDVDMRIETRYLLENGIYPLSHVRITDRFELLDDPDWGRDPLPPLRANMMDVEVKRSGPLPLMDDPISRVSLGEWSLSSGDEPEMITSLVDRIEEADPDVLLTAGGDSFVIPYLYHRACIHGVQDRLVLDRSGDPVVADKKEGMSYFTYGSILYKPPPRLLNGRLHLDVKSSFNLKEGGLLGVAILSRMSLLPIQSMARLSPGSAISSMECAEAKRRGYAVRWKKNLPEGWKTAVELSLTDRGGHIFDPITGAFSDVVEMDFSSFYPHIMMRKNISLETLNCSCCGGSGTPVPGLPYRICKRQDGLIPAVIGEILSRRLEYKRRAKGEGDLIVEGEEELGPLRAPEGRKRYGYASNMLKWVLVTCFGYTGYKNARFGRIEAHESITAYARELMLQAKETAESRGFSVLHGIVDSLWLAGPPGDEEALAEGLEKRTGIPISVEAKYRWIVFLRNRTNGVGALTRYYGFNEVGDLKVRGLEVRQHSTPTFVSSVQEGAIRTLSGARSAGEVRQYLEGTLNFLRREGGRLLERSVDPSELSMCIRISRALDDYRTDSEHVAAVRLLKRTGFRVNPGEKVRFVVLDHGARRPEERVRILEDGMEGTQYDVDRYMELTARAVGGALSVFGLDENRALLALKGMEQASLSGFSRSRI